MIQIESYHKKIELPFIRFILYLKLENHKIQVYIFIFNSSKSLTKITTVSQ